jgi:ferric-dicitrate binding protein FerR (iron transport regulator)
MAPTSSLRCAAAPAPRPRPARWKRTAHPPRNGRRRRSDVAATLGAVVAIVLCLATARWWSPLVSVPLGVATALLIRHAPGRSRRSGR